MADDRFYMIRVKFKGNGVDRFLTNEGQPVPFAFEELGAQVKHIRDGDTEHLGDLANFGGLEVETVQILEVRAVL